ncbi:LRIG2 [Branchiostoma lanceolatum]|uniref:LRIG2 protein n=1 Tax=Branchiostoma lanceolatum TaxID=7740 RepID=A0A8J9Z8X0_BRALA|nr:LRIG2 [Branchiostoma lanceolatum]
MNHPFGVLTAETLSAFSYAWVQTLVLVLGQIVEVEENAFGGFEYLQTLGLDFNNLTRVKQSWLFGLTELAELRLTYNRIEQIDPGCFSNLKMLQTLNLKGNLLQHIDPAWFHGLHADELILGENNIRSIPPSTFHKMRTMFYLSLESNQLSCLDMELGSWVESLSLFDVGGDSLVTISDDVPQRMSWTLDIDSDTSLHTETISLHVSTFSFCITNDQGRHEKHLQWKVRAAGVASYSICSTDVYDDGVRSLTVTLPFVVLATEDGLSQNATDQCRRVWEHNWGVTVDLKSNSSFQVVSLGVGNTSVAMLFFDPHDTNTVSTKGSDTLNNSSYADIAHTKNITCILVSIHDHWSLNPFTIPKVQRNPQKPCPGSNTDQLSVLTSKPSHTTEENRPENLTGMVSKSTPQVRTDHRTNPEQGLSEPEEQGLSEPEGVLNPVVVSIVIVEVVLVVLCLVGCLLKIRQVERQATVDAPARECPGLVSCRTLPPGLCTVSQPIYSEIPDNVAAAQRILPALPHTYVEIPDHIAAAQRPLPTLPHTYAEIPDHIAAAQRLLPTLPNTYWEIPGDAIHGVAKSARFKTWSTLPAIRRDVSASRWSLPASLHPVKPTTNCDNLEDELITPYAAVAEPSLPTVTKTRKNQRMYESNGVYSAAGRLAATYGVPRAARVHCVSTYGNPGNYWPRKTPGRGTRNTPRRASLPLVTLPNTYWPWEIPGEGTINTPRRASLPLVTPPNTYWPWQIPGEGTCNTLRRASVTLTLPNTYWAWQIPGEGTRNTPRRASLPLTLPNTYWPWEIPGEGTRNTPRRVSLPLTLPNTYWPWQIPGEGTRNTPRRASLPLTLPNTYWPWEIPGEGTCNTPGRASLPLTLPNTYWPWEIPGEGTRNTPRRASLPLTLPDTYWP